MLAAAITAENSETRIQLYDMREGSRMYDLKGHLNLIHCLDWYHDSSFLVSASSDLTVGV